MQRCLGIAISRSVDRETGEARRSMASLAAALGITVSAVEKGIRRLAVDHIAIERRPLGRRSTEGKFGQQAFGGRGGASAYRLRPRPDVGPVIEAEQGSDIGPVNHDAETGRRSGHSETLTGRRSEDRPDARPRNSLKKKPLHARGRARENGALPARPPSSERLGRFYQSIERAVGSADFASWFRDVDAIEAIDGDGVRIVAPSSLFADRIRQDFAEKIASKVGGRVVVEVRRGQAA